MSFLQVTGSLRNTVILNIFCSKIYERATKICRKKKLVRLVAITNNGKKYKGKSRVTKDYREF